MAVGAATEIELKFDAPGDVALPEPPEIEAALAAGPVGQVQVRDDGTVRLAATYFDTADLRLASERITLRRRTGGKDAGWHLKLPAAAGERLELTAPLGRPGQVPAELRDVVLAVVRTASLDPVARLETRRTIRTVLALDGTPLAELVDDRVTASRPQDGDDSQVWREFEVELLEGGDRQLLAELAELLRQVGAAPSASASKLSRALGPVGPPLVEPPADSVSPKQPVARAVEAYTRAHVAALLLQDRRVRRDLPDSVHKMRVAARRLRSTLRTFGPVLDPDAVAALEPELRWLGLVLGEARDREVLLERLRADLDTLPADLVVGDVAGRLDRVLVPELEQAVEDAKRELRGERYLQLVERLLAFAAEVPVTSTDHAGDVLPRLAHRAWRRVRRRMSDIGPGAQDALDATDEMLHRARKAAKQARYAGEAMVVVYGPKAADFAAAMESMQELLGEHQDSTVSRQLLRRLGGGSGNGFTFGVMHGTEAARAHQVREQLPAAWDQAGSKKLRRWMSRS